MPFMLVNCCTVCWIKPGREQVNNELSLLIGSKEDRVLGSSIAVLLCVQLGAGSESEAVFKTLKPHLITIIQDQTAGSAARASVRICQ